MPQDITRHKSYTKAVIAFGSNVACGELSSEMLVRAAFSGIAGGSVRILAASGLYRTPAVPAGAGPDYVNAAALVETSLGAPELLAFLHEIENRYERRRERRWAPRTLDLDLLDFGGSVVPDREAWRSWHDLPLADQKTRFPDRMILPHPRLQERAFVLVPLAEIAPDWRHPVLGRSAADLLADLGEEGRAGISLL